IFTEDADESRTALNAILGDHGYITRMYTRISGWEMLADPTFVPSESGVVSNIIDLSGRPPVDGCGDAERVPCGDTYCGDGAQCASTEGGPDGCICPEGSLAREIVSPNGGREIHCQPESFDLLQSMESGTEGPCANNPCGENGACAVTSGFATCSCDAGYAAISTFSGAPRCERVANVFAVTQLLAPMNDSGCSCQSSRPEAMAPWLMLLGVVFVLRRRRA
ncbi:MAG: MYXO-CTERM sorting domain-containing protein, partial [Myxococcota bacterium]